MKHKLVLILFAVVLLASVNPVIAQEGVGETSDICQRAKLDAQADVNKMLWFGAGCLFGIFGLGAAYIIEPSPPATRLLGKPPEYVAVYTDCYRDEAKRIRTKGAWLGCVVGSVLSVAWYVVLVAAAASESD